MPSDHTGFLSKYAKWSHWLQKKRTQERCVLLKRMHAQPCFMSNYAKGSYFCKKIIWLNVLMAQCFTLSNALFYMQSWASDNVLASWQQQRDNRASVTSKIQNILRSWCLNGVGTTNVEIIPLSTMVMAWKHGHVVAAVLSRAQLWLRVCDDEPINVQDRQGMEEEDDSCASTLPINK